MRSFTKSFFLMLAALFSFSMAFAETGTETEANQKNGNKNTTAEGQSYTIDGAYIAGGGSKQAPPMTSKGLKFRTAVNGNTLEFTVRENYTITKLYIAAIGNYVADDNTLPYVKVTKVEVDGTEVEFDGGEFPDKEASAAAELTVDDIAATQKIVLYFDNSNASAGTQLNASWSINWERPDATQPFITVTPKTLALVPGATSKLSVHVDPSSFTTQWVSSDESVATVTDDGTVTAVAPGTATIYNQWTDNAEVADGTVVTVAEFNPAAYIPTLYDFTSMGDVSLTLSEEVAGAIWNEGNNKPNNVFFCTNEGLENIAVQAALSGGKGWSIIDGQGLVLASGAGRCAAVGNLKAGQIVEIYYTGNNFYTGSKNDAVRKDDGAPKTALNEGVGRAIYQMDEDGLLGFELEKGKAVTKIIVYTSALIEAKAALQEAIDKIKAMNISKFNDAIAAAEAALNADDATVESIMAAAQTLENEVKNFGKEALRKVLLLAGNINIDNAEFNTALATANDVMGNTDATAEDYIAALTGLLNVIKPKVDTFAALAADLADEYGYTEVKTAVLALTEALNNKDVDAAIVAATTLMAQLKPTANDFVSKLQPYLDVLDNAELNAAVQNILTIANASNIDFGALLDAVKDASAKFIAASAAFVNKMKTEGPDADDFKAALADAEAAVFAENPNILAVGKAIKNLIDAYKVTTGISSIVTSHTSTLNVYNLAGQQVKKTQKGLYIINGKKVMK